MLKRYFSAIIIFFLLGACTSPQVVSFLNTTIDFSEFRSYRIISPAEGEYEVRKDSSAVRHEIEKLLKQEMQARNYVYRNKSDLRLQYHFVTNNKTNLDITPNYYSRNLFYSPYYPRYNSYNIRQRNFYEAILLIELIDSKAKTVWQGSLDLRYTKNIQNKEDILPNAVSKIFETYPYAVDTITPAKRVEN